MHRPLAALPAGPAAYPDHALRDARRGFAALATILSLAAPTFASAAPVTWFYEAEIVDVTTYNPFGFSPGDRITGRFTFEQATPDSDGHPDVAYFVDAVTDSYAIIDGSTVLSGALPTMPAPSPVANRIGLDDGRPGSPSDTFIAIFFPTEEFFLSLFLSDPTNRYLFGPPVLYSTLPSFAPPLELLDPYGATGIGFSTLDGFSLGARLTSLSQLYIPEPAPWQLLAIGLGWLAVHRRYESRSR